MATRVRELPTRLSKEISDRFQIANNTLSRDVKDNPKDRITVEIGDSKQPDFKPQAKLMRWDNETNFSLRWKEPEDQEPLIETEGKVIRYKNGKQSFQAYELDPSDIGEDGGLEIEVVLDEKPTSNKIEFTIQTKGLEFYYQPPLTQEEIDEGASRPENVEGSYAVYHSVKGGMNASDGMEYKSGKAFHIYRPKITDANGNTTWGDLSITEELVEPAIKQHEVFVKLPERQGTLAVTIDQTWLDNAVYPVVVDPTFGYTTAGSSLLEQFSGSVVGNKITIPADVGTVESLTASCKAGDPGTTDNFKALIVETTGLTIITNGIGAGVNFGDTKDWRTSSFGTPPTPTPSTEYAICTIHSVNPQMFYDSSGSTEVEDFSNNYASPQNIGSWGVNNGSRLFSIYATYTSAGGAPVSAPSMTVNTNFWGS